MREARLNGRASADPRPTCSGRASAERRAPWNGGWHRAGSAAVFGALLAATATHPGCACGDDTSNAGSAASSSAGAGGSGGAGGNGAGGSGEFTVHEVANDATKFISPFDATPDPEGAIVYFTAVNLDGKAGVFTAPAVGGAVSEVFVGDPFVSPFGIAISTDGTKLFVVDSGAQSSDADDAGLIFVVTLLGGAPVVLSGGASTRPAGIEVHHENGQDQIYFTGTSKIDGKPGVFKISSNGAAGGPTVVTTQGFVDPSGIAIAEGGGLFVADTIAGANGSTSVLEVDVQGVATPFVTGLSVGYPTGVALTRDGATLLVSGLDPVTDTDVVSLYSTLDPTRAERVAFPASIPVGTFFEPAGIHRAKNADVFAWAESKANGTGTVYVISR